MRDSFELKSDGFAGVTGQNWISPAWLEVYLPETGPTNQVKAIDVKQIKAEKGQVDVDLKFGIRGDEFACRSGPLCLEKANCYNSAIYM